MTEEMTETERKIETFDIDYGVLETGLTATAGSLSKDGSRPILMMWEIKFDGPEASFVTTNSYIMSMVKIRTWDGSDFTPEPTGFLLLSDKGPATKITDLLPMDPKSLASGRVVKVVKSNQTSPAYLGCETVTGTFEGELGSRNVTLADLSQYADYSRLWPSERNVDMRQPVCFNIEMLNAVSTAVKRAGRLKGSHGTDYALPRLVHAENDPRKPIIWQFPEWRINGIGREEYSVSMEVLQMPVMIS